MKNRKAANLVNIRQLCSISAAFCLFLSNYIAIVHSLHNANMGSAQLPFFSSSSTEEQYAGGNMQQRGAAINARTPLRMSLIHRHELEMRGRQHVSRMQDLIIKSIQFDKARLKALSSCKYTAYKSSASSRNPSPTTPSLSPRGAIASSHPSLSSKSTSPSPDKKKGYFEGGVISGASLPGNIGQYFVELFVGTPQQRFLFITDTGSDLIWIPCSLCKSCQSQQSNMSSSPSMSFYPEASSTFTPITCSSKECTFIPPPPGETCNSTSPTNCTYAYAYSDLSQTKGFFAYDTITMRSSGGGTSTKLENVAFGCGTNNTGPSITNQGGVLGLGQGPISFSSQAARKYGSKFSYCFTSFFHRKSRSALIFGDDREGAKLESSLQFTSFVPNPTVDTFYHLQIERVEVDKQAMPIKPSVFEIDEHGEGGAIIDSGTTLTFFAEPAFQVIFEAFKKRVHYPLAPPTAGLELCYNVSTIHKPRFPRISIIFKSGAIFRPPPRNYFLSPTQEIRCLGFLQGGKLSILGNLVQQNYYVEYDRLNNQLGFAKANCSASF